MKRIGVISDTHGTFDKALRDFLSDVDEIWHAGDFGSIELADEIAKFKPLKGVYGNIDGGVMRRTYNEFSFFECEGKRVLITHIGGYPRHYSPQGTYDPIYQLLHINPGAAGIYGFHKVRTAIRFVIDGDDIRDMEIGEWTRLQE